jgi:nucleotide-binding universal stress UspA family protein
MYKKVLVPLDVSDVAEGTLDHVKALVKEGFAEEVTLLNVVNIDTRYVELYGKNFDTNKMRAALCASARKSLAKIGSQLNAEGIKVKTETLEADSSPASKIKEYAKKNGVELIIIGTHGYTGMKKLIKGSISSEVLNSSPVPVLLIRPEPCRL